MHYKYYTLALLLTASLHAESVEELIDNANNALHARQASIALTHLEKAYKLDPHNKNVLELMAKTSFHLKNYDAAFYCYQNVLALDPLNVSALFNSAVIANKQGKFTTATSLFTLASKQNSHEMITTNLLKNYLRQSQWHKAAAILKPTLWWYDENIFEKTILLELDKPGNGLGDALQFLRYAQILKQAGAHVIVQVHEPLVPLFSRCSYIDSVITNNSPVPRVYKKFGICIASLMIKSKNMIPLTTPYLDADPALITYWHDRIAADNNFKIGICISSNMVIDQWSGQRQANPRSIPAQELIFLTKMTGISLYNLQKDSVDTQLLSPITFDDFDGSHGRFMDSAALMKNMDLIITVDTSIAHLAGALGVPTYVLLSTESDYRWLIDRHDSPYYPSITLFRQKIINDWSTVTTQLHAAIQARIINATQN